MHNLVIELLLILAGIILFVILFTWCINFINEIFNITNNATELFKNMTNAIISKYL